MQSLEHPVHRVVHVAVPTCLKPRQGWIGMDSYPYSVRYEVDGERRARDDRPGRFVPIEFCTQADFSTVYSVLTLRMLRFA